MFAALKSFLSVHVAPGASNVNFAPFSFAWGARVEGVTNLGADEESAAKLLNLTADLMDVDRMLDADDLRGGRDRVKAMLRELTAE